MTSYFIAVFLGTFALEDAALAGAVALMHEQKLTFAAAFTACFMGIAIGDMGLYFAGSFFGHHFTSLRRFSAPRSFSAMIVISRVIPGTRLPTYLGAGFLRFPLWRFTILTALSVGAWVLLVLVGGKAVQLLSGHVSVVIAAFLCSLWLVRSWLPKLLDPWGRRAMVHSWRRWTHFEFWPAWLFYLPIIPLYIYRSLRGGSFLLPFYANPLVINGGLIGESKWDFLRHLPPEDPATLTTTLVKGGLPHPHYPLVLKPDVGQRGYGVRIVRSTREAESYLLESEGSAVLAQEFSTFSNEAGIFYFRRPPQAQGTIFSITDKIVPVVAADGVSRLGDLILNDARARIIAPVYFARHRAQLDTVFAVGHRIHLGECGNHCQGAIFKNGRNLMSAKLTERIDSIAKKIPHFYFGRFDVKYRDAESFKRGLHFKIVEINGAGSEATHIWDQDTTLVEAYQVLFAQWKILFDIGAEVKRSGLGQARVSAFLFEVFRVVRRNNKLSISS